MNYKHFRQNFKNAVLFKNVAHSFKEGAYLYLPGSEVAKGEASPLPEFSKESLSDVLGALEKLQLPNIKDPYFNYSIITELSSLQFGLSMMMHQELSDLPEPKNIQIQGLLQGDLSNIQEKALKLQSDNILVAKMKVGRGSGLEEKKALEFVFKNTNLVLRLDSNQKWRLSEALDFLKDLPKERIEYLEEPLKNPNELELLYSKTNIPYALDENIQKFQNHSLKGSLKGLKAIVLKPTLLGDLKSLRDIISDYTRSSELLEVVISSSYESKVGLNYLKQLALMINPDGYHGLDTEGALSDVEFL